MVAHLKPQLDLHEKSLIIVTRNLQVDLQSLTPHLTLEEFSSQTLHRLAVLRSGQMLHRLFKAVVLVFDLTLITGHCSLA